MKGIYKLFDHGRLVYIGKSTRNIKSRVIHHINMGKIFDTAELYEINNTSDIAILETYLISKYKPFYNTEYHYEDEVTIKIQESDYINNPIVMKDELKAYKESIDLTNEKTIIDISIAQMLSAGMSFEEIIEVINNIAESE